MPKSNPLARPPETILQQMFIQYAKRVRLFAAVASLSLLLLLASVLIVKLVTEPDAPILLRPVFVVVLGAFVGLTIVLAERWMLTRQAHAQAERLLPAKYERTPSFLRNLPPATRKSMQVVVPEEVQQEVQQSLQMQQDALVQRILQGQLDDFKEKPDVVAVWRNTGDALTALELYDEAYRAYIHAHNLQPNDELTSSKLTLLDDLARIRQWREWPPKEQSEASALPSEKGVKSTLM